MSVGGQTTGNQPFGGWKGEVDSNGVEYGKKLLNPKSERGTKESEENKTHASKAQQLKGEKKNKKKKKRETKRVSRQSSPMEGKACRATGQESSRKRRPSHDSKPVTWLRHGCGCVAELKQNKSS